MLDSFLPPIDPKIVKKIAEELNEDPDRVSNNIKLLADWIKYQQHLPKNYDPCILPSYLRGCKQNLDKAKKKIEAFFIALNTQSDIFGNISPTLEGDLRCFKYINFVLLPELTPEGYRVVIFQLANNDPSLYENFRAIRCGTMITTMIIHHDCHKIAGNIAILDVRGATANHVAKYLCNMTRKYYEFLQTATPVILKQFHVLTDSAIATKAVGVVKSLFKEKMRNRFHVWSNHENLRDFIPLDCLPSDFGGNLKSLKEYSDELCKYMSNSDFFERLDQMKLTGPIPKDRMITFSNEDFGLDGSFRKLNLD